MEADQARGSLEDRLGSGLSSLEKASYPAHI